MGFSFSSFAKEKMRKGISRLLSNSIPVLFILTQVCQCATRGRKCNEMKRFYLEKEKKRKREEIMFVNLLHAAGQQLHGAVGDSC